MASVLVVDDSSMARRNLKNILISAGHSIVSEATNGVQAFVEYEKYKPDLVTMDITMPILSGIESVKKIINSYPEAKIIMVSALNQRVMIFDALQNGAKHYIVKPFSYEKVIEVVDEVLQTTYKPVKIDISNSSAAKKIFSHAESSEASIQRPFVIQNTDGVHIVNISKNISEKNIGPLKLGVQRISSSQPLKVVLNFGDTASISNGVFDMILQVINIIKEAGGSCAITSQNQNFILYASSMNINIPVRLYSGSLKVSEIEF
ncbi:MAG: response regulator [Bacillota bacterium]